MSGPDGARSLHRGGLVRLALTELARTPWLVAILIGLSVVLAGLSVVPPLLVGRSVDAALAGSLTRDGLIVATAAVIAAVATESGLLYLRRRIAVSLELSVRDRMATEHFAASLRLPATALRNGGEPALIRSFDDLDTVVEFVANRSVETFAQSLIAIGYVAIMAIVSLPLAAVFIVLSGIGLVGSLRSAERLERAVGTWLTARDRRFEHIVECVTSLLTIRTLGAHRGVARPFAAAQEREQEALADFRIGAAVADVWARTWAILVPTLGALVGVAFMWQGRITAGDVVVFLSLSGGLSAASIALFEGARRFHEARASLDRLDRTTDCEPELPLVAPPARPRRVSGLVGAGLTVVHEAAVVPTFADLSLTLAPGEHVAVIGRSGGGKTTLALALARLLATRAGRVEVAGELLPLADHRATVVLVPHQVAIWSADVRDNVTLWNDAVRDVDVLAALAAAGLGDFVDGLEHGLDTTLGSRGVQLSAGQRQRLGLARVFLIDPPVVILDEATSALDPRTEAFVLANLRRAMAGRNLVVVTHREAVAATFDRVMRLEDGVLHEVDPRDAPRPDQADEIVAGHDEATSGRS